MPASLALPSGAARVLRGAGNRMLDAVLPPRCLACGAIIEAAHALCASCWPRVRFLTEPLCASCGVPFEFEVAGGSVCAACAGTSRPWAIARAAIAYDDGSRAFILAFKNGDRTSAARTFAPWMAASGRRLLIEADLLVPVPLHWTRLFARKYNQAALLAQAVGRLAGRAVAVDLLRRSKRTRKLGTSGPRERAETVRAAFTVAERRRRELVGRRVLLIDDVFTTGSTAAACARTLLRAGAAAVDVLTLARVVRPSVIPVPPHASRQSPFHQET